MQKNSSKVIPSSSLGDFQQWQPPEVASVSAQKMQGKPGGLMTASQLEDLERQAFEDGLARGKQEGFEYGRKEGLLQGKQRIAQLTDHLDRLIQTLNKPLQQLDEQMEQQLLTLVISMVRQMVRREVKSDPNQIIGVVREALSILPVASNNVRIILHPEDAVLIREVYSLNEAEPGWKIVEDPVVARGGCRVLTDNSQIDATLESRLSALIAPLLVGERTADEVELAEKDNS